jgi:BED zinc finger
MPDLDIETKYYSKTNNQLEWRCKYCLKRYALNGGTRCIKSHLKTIHNVSEDSPREERAKQRQLSIEDALATSLANPQKRRCLEILDSTNSHINLD